MLTALFGRLIRNDTNDCFCQCAGILVARAKSKRNAETSSKLALLPAIMVHRGSAKSALPAMSTACDNQANATPRAAPSIGFRGERFFGLA